MLRSALAFSLALSLSLAVLPGRAAADEAEEARALFESADAALDEGRFAAARDLLRRSIALHPHRATAFNLAVALRGTGEVSESIEVFEQLLAGGFGELEAERRDEVGRLLEQVRAEVARLSVRACGAPEIDIRLDGAPALTLPDCGRATLSVDPGAHIVRFDAVRAESIERRLVLERGERASLDVGLELLAEPEARGENVLESPWLWLSVGGAIVAGAAVLLVAILARPTNPHVTDDVFGEIVALRR
jgi:tetratricopeptide (TPR) repeat protein